MSESVSDGNLQVVTRVKIVGVGGGGVNTVERLMSGGALSPEAAQNATFAAVNTDVQSLNGSPVERKIVIGRALTRGLGAGGEVALGRRAAEADRESLDALVADTDLVVLIVALGGGTGSGAAPVIAEAAAKAGAMVIAFVTLPFSWEGERRMKQAREALDALREACEAVIPLQNDALLQGDAADASANDAFDRANDWICAGLNALCSMLFKKGLINIDFATLRSALPVRGGRTLFGVGSASGENRHKRVVEQLYDCPLLHTNDSVRTADTLIINIVGGAGLSFARVQEIVAAVKEKFGGKENTVLGAIIDENLGDTLEVCVFGSAGIARKMKAPTARRPNEIRSAAQAEDPESFEGETDILAADKAEADELADAARGESEAPAGARPRPARGAPVRPATAPEQTELTFDGSADFFADAHSFVDGQDVDIPTFQRRHIRIRL